MRIYQSYFKPADLTLALTFQVFGSQKSGFPRLYFDCIVYNMKSKETVFARKNVVK
jgi:hypothetical protein